MPTEIIIWTPLPNGYINAATKRVQLSVFVSPRLEGASTLGSFPHWRNWPNTLKASDGPLPFDVTFEGYPPITVAPDLAVLSADQWSAVFDPATTGVDSYTYVDYSTIHPTSFSAGGVSSYVSGAYAAIGAKALALPPLLRTEQGALGLVGGTYAKPDPYTEAYESLVELSGRGANSAVANARAFHTFPAAAEHFKPTVAPVLDFHQAISSLGSFPRVLVSFGLVFRLDVPLPSGLTLSSTPKQITVQAQPHWGSGTKNGVQTINVVLSTLAELSTGQFLASPSGPNYKLGTLDLRQPAFSVIDLDVDGAAESLSSLSASLRSLGTWLQPLEQTGATVAMPVPALRSIGPSIVWSGWGGTASAPGTDSLNALAQNQTAIQNAVQQWVDWYQHAVPRPPEPALPVLRAEDIIRGHRFDVHDDAEPVPAWRSLHERVGQYTFGTSTKATYQDEGTVVPGATQPTTKTGTLPELYVHESIARWAGWSLAAPRPGPSVAPDDTVDDNPTNPVPSNTDSSGNQNPQLAVNFKVVPKSLPKLRFGRRYSYRARAVDMSGHSLPVTDAYSATATAPVTHYRYEPVASPVIIPTAALGPGEANLLLAIRNYQTTPDNVAANGRWLFPPKASETMVEEHGMLDGYIPGHPPVPDQAPTPAAYTLLSSRVDGTVETVPGAQQVTTQSGSSYTYLPIPANGLPAPVPTPWLPDPLSSGARFQGLPAPSAFEHPGPQPPAILRWPGGIWPGEQPVLLLLGAGALPTNELVPATSSTAAVAKVTLPPAYVANVFISSTISLPALATLGVWSWILAVLPAAERKAVAARAIEGGLWMLTPFRVVRMVHAVRLPLEAPRFRAPVVKPRTYGSVQATLTDASFLVSEISTASVDVEATWTDPVDNLANPGPTTVTTAQHAFKLIVPDPEPLGPFAQPMKVIAPPTVFALSPGGSGAVHTIGDTKHHDVSYTCTGTSRFVEFFRQTVTQTFTSAPFTVDLLGLDEREVVITDKAVNPPYVLRQGVDYKVDAKAGQVTILASKYQGVPLDVTWAPTDTLTGAGHRVQVLSSARPAAPKVAKVTPAWSVSGVGGSLASGGLTYSRKGGYLRVYLERPWFSSGADELLGVVAVPPGSGTFYAGLSAADQAQWTTTMGLDPISLSSGTQGYPVSPSSFTGTVKIPPVPYRPEYSSPPSLKLVEDAGPSAPHLDIWPFEVHYDPASELWFADVGITIGTQDSAPPPGYFVRLAVVRFQPFAFPGAEISTVTLATFAQPVANRSVSVTQGKEPQTVVVTVTGPGYYGYRPLELVGTQIDVDNPDAVHTYSSPPYPAATPGSKTSSLMLVEIQTEDTSKGLSGDLAWTTVQESSPVPLAVSFSGGPVVTWSATVRLPPHASAPMRLRISEVDYPTSVPTTVDTALRRPFVAFVPLFANPAVHTAPA